MDQAVICDAKRWQGWRGYLYLFFYRDYKKAVADLNATDSLTPHFIDNPQGHSVDYWRGHAYLGMKDYKNSIVYYQKHIDKVVNDYGEDWVEPDAFLNLGIAFFEHGMLDSVPALLNKALQYYDNKSADTKYYWALYEQSQGDREKALEWVHKAIEDFKLGHSKERPYNEEIRQVYFEELEELESLLK